MADLDLQFIYDDTSGEKQFYLPGDMLRGTIHLRLRRSLRVRSLCLIVLGDANVSWEESARKKIYSAREEYLHATKTLLDAGSDDSIDFSRGVHQFSFQYQLPANLPSTFSGVYGSVSYVAKVVLNAEDDSAATVTSEPFMVLSRPPLPLSTYSEQELKSSKYFLGFLTGGKVKVQCRISRCAAIPGEIIYINAEVNNWSPKEVTHIQAAVILESTYNSRVTKGKQIFFRQVLNKRVDVYDVNNRFGRRWRNVQMAIPPYLPDSGLDNCSIIDIRYLLEFRAQILDQDDLIVTFPLYVGSRPLGYEENNLDLDRDFRVQGLGGPRNIQEHANFTTFSEKEKELPWYKGGGPKGGIEVLTESLNGNMFDLRR